MSTTPGSFPPLEPEDRETTGQVPEPASSALEPAMDSPPALESSPFLSRHYELPESHAEPRIPNMGHVAILALIALCGLFGASLAARAALEMHLFGVTTLTQATNDIHYTLGTEGILYLLTLVGSVVIFPLLWHKSLFAGLQWRGRTALALRGRLISSAVICFLLALVNGILIPGPENTPIDRLFRTPGAAWLLFAFGVTAAPFFEELAFRGFLLPAFCTAFDWMGEQYKGLAPQPLDEYGHPNWSRQAMGAASVVTSILFALLHGDQTGYSLGPFLLLVCVSLVLSWARLGTRSLAASVVVHACYNFILFSFMFLGTSGFRHLDKM
jgi:membrane protease YdiL (CAAX protease family)